MWPASRQTSQNSTLVANRSHNLAGHCGVSLFSKDNYIALNELRSNRINKLLIWDICFIIFEYTGEIRPSMLAMISNYQQDNAWTYRPFAFPQGPERRQLSSQKYSDWNLRISKGVCLLSPRDAVMLQIFTRAPQKVFCNVIFKCIVFVVILILWTIKGKRVYIRALLRSQVGWRRVCCSFRGRRKNAAESIMAYLVCSQLGLSRRAASGDPKRGTCSSN